MQTRIFLALCAMFQNQETVHLVLRLLLVFPVAKQLQPRGSSVESTAHRLKTLKDKVMSVLTCTGVLSCHCSWSHAGWQLFSHHLHCVRDSG